MTRRGYWLVAGAYMLLTIGAVITVVLLSRQADSLEATNQRLIVAAAAYCEAGLEPDAQENPAIDALSRGQYEPDVFPDLDPICQRIVRRLQGDE